MEVHHHGYVHHKSKWKEYLFQFLMLFMAVFLGFLAEYRLEHFIEHKRTAQLAKNLYQEMKSDSANVQRILKGRLFKEECLKYTIGYFKDSSLTSLSKEFYPRLGIAFILTQYYSFEPKDGVLNQLINSGALRYFRNVQLQKYLGEIAVAINNIKSRNEQEYIFVSQNIRPFMFNHYDYEWNNILTRDGTIPIADALQNYLAGDKKMKVELKNLKKLDRQFMYNISSHYLLILRGTRQLQIDSYIKINKNLLQALRENYNVEN